MAPSLTRIRFNAVVSGVSATIKHFTSRDYPEDWDLAFHIQFAILRQLLANTNHWTVEEFQEMTTKVKAPPKGTWTIPVTIHPTEEEKRGIESEVRKVIAKLGPGIDKLTVSCSTDLHAEWQAAKNTPDYKSSNRTNEENYAELDQQTQDGPVILYLHGGAYIVCSINTHRPLTARLAKDCGGRVFAVNYRLAPQNEFPAALVDAVMAYKYLVDPPRGSLHKAVDPSKIVVAGDSAGGGLVFALMVFLAHATPTFPLPAGVLGTSPWLDLTHSFPSARVDRGYDYLPNPWEAPVAPKSSPAWPPAEPRYHFYSDIPLHPLVSPVVAAMDLPPCPPVFIVVGDNEYLRDETLYFVRNFIKGGGRARLQNYKSMPHVFQIFANHPSTETCFREYARFIKDVTTVGKGIESELRYVNGKGQIETTELDLEKYNVGFTKEELIKRMETEVGRRFEKMSLERRGSRLA